MAIGVVAMWQGTDALNAGDLHWLMIFVGLGSAALVIQSLCSVGLAIGAAKAQKKLLATVEEMKTAALPVIGKSSAFIEEMTPKLREITDNVAHISSVAKAKVDAIEPTVDQINETVADANRKTKAQISRVDGMVSSALTATGELAAQIHEGIRGPVREISGVLAGFRVGLETLLGRGYRPVPPTTAPGPVAVKPVAQVVPVKPAGGPAPDAAAAAAAETRVEMSFAAYRDAMQAKRKDLDL